MISRRTRRPPSPAPTISTLRWLSRTLEKPARKRRSWSVRASTRQPSRNSSESRKKSAMTLLGSPIATVWRWEIGCTGRKTAIATTASSAIATRRRARSPSSRAARSSSSCAGTRARGSGRAAPDHHPRNRAIAQQRRREASARCRSAARTRGSRRARAALHPRRVWGRECRCSGKAAERIRRRITRIVRATVWLAGGLQAARIRAHAR